MAMCSIQCAVCCFHRMVCKVKMTRQTMSMNKIKMQEDADDENVENN